jgi:hypothetical protein
MTPVEDPVVEWLLAVGAHFLSGDDRLGPLGQAILDAQLDDGGWNCALRRRPATRHSSFHTTFNVLVEMERPGTDSRWNTLRALRVLRRYDG